MGSGRGFDNKENMFDNYSSYNLCASRVKSIRIPPNLLLD